MPVGRTLGLTIRLLHFVSLSLALPNPSHFDLTVSDDCGTGFDELSNAFNDFENLLHDMNPNNGEYYPPHRASSMRLNQGGSGRNSGSMAHVPWRCNTDDVVEPSSHYMI